MKMGVTNERVNAKCERETTKEEVSEIKIRTRKNTKNNNTKRN